MRSKKKTTKKIYIIDRGNNDVRIMRHDADRNIWIESRQFQTISEAASTLFYGEYEERKSCSATALEDAHATVLEALPDGIEGRFDDDYLTFITVDDEEAMQ